MSDQSVPNVSILSAVYNEELYIDEMIESVIAQTEPNWELLFVDDGSTDNTVKRIVRASTLDSRIKLVGQGRKLGKVGAFNLAFEHARGELVVLLAGDDRLPQTSLAVRLAVLAESLATGEKRAAAFRLVTFSDNPKFHGLVIPRRAEGNLSGGTVAMTRTLAKDVFPIPAGLVAEDVWIAEAIRAIAPEVSTSSEIVLEYRIHPENSNPRAQPFRTMNDSMHKRARPYQLLLNDPRFTLGSQARRRLEKKLEVEQLRYDGNVVGLLALKDVGMIDRLRALSSSNRLAWSIRKAFFRLLSGQGGS